MMPEHERGRRWTSPVAKIEDRQEFVRLVRDEKMRNRDILAYYAERGIHLRPSAISMAKRRYGLDVREAHGDLLPWTVHEDHRGLYAAKMLRLEGRRRRGDKLSEDQLRYLSNWKRKLEDDGTVVHYEYDTEEGWFYVPRRPGIDNDLIRDPKFEDDGSPVAS
jgi:hypothetical protein